ncbi:VOC family protein [uncultured Lentibacter sp.]|jgi:catechol 2,3-dioxygenase-like lactoylglutathione lyase family enzyme|uniref:VOC family protein n=1 Tax=uncultured Lentibacter sp. TaxID=1659309 RepID=UPI00261521AD|nr:VOC family protein [uncultured Lentibacter sp.]
MAVRIVALDHLVLTVADIGVTLAFYERHLGMVAQVFEAADGTRRHSLQFGAQKINVHAAGREFSPHAKQPCPGSADLCFLVQGAVSDVARALDAQGVPVEAGPVARTGATGPLNSIYLRDPDGNLIELSEPL